MPGRVSSPVFVGRGAELQRIEGALDRARGGQTVHLLVAGEAGVGKTRLTAEATRMARERGFRVLRGECISVGGSSLPYGPIVAALRGLVDSLDPREVAGIAGPAASDLARLVPGLGPGSSAPSVQSEWVQSRLFEGLLGLLNRLAERSPVLLIVEDLHWADPATRDAIAFLVRALGDAPLLLLGTYRSDELHRRHPLLAWLAELERYGRVERVELTRLDRLQIAALVGAILGTEAAPELVEDVFARSDGNPFFAEELLAAGHRAGSGPRLPPTLKEILLAHIATVPEPAPAVLGVAAVAGRRVEHDLLARVAGLPEDRLHEGLHAAVGGHLLVVESEGDLERYAFRHALVQEVMYDELLPGERRSLHRAFAEALETQAIGSGASEAGHWAELAHHWAAAREDTRAFAASLKAADAAMSAFAFRAALQEYERALELWDGGSDGDERPPFDRVELLRLAGLAAYLAADYRRAVAHRREALAEVRPDEDPVRVGMLQEQLGRALWLNGDSSAALEAYRTAVATIPEQPPSAERARAVSGLGQILMLRSRHEESRILCEEAIAIARAVGARAEEGHALNTLGLDLASLGDAERGLEALREALRIARDAHNADDTGRAYVNLAESLDRAGDTAGALALASEGIRVTEELGVAHSYGYFIRMDAAAYAHLVGDWAEARRLMAEAATRVPSGAGAELYRLTRTLPVFVGEGSFDVADAGLRRVFELITDNPDAEYIGPAYAAAAERELWRHAPAAALDLVEAGMERLSATDDRFETSQMSRLGAWAAGDLAEEALAARDEARLAAARARFHRLRAQVEGLADGVAGPRLDHELETNRALFAAEATRVEGHPDAAAWRGMAERWTALDRPYLAAYARWREAEAALATGDRATAGEALRAARSVAMELQASPLLTAVEGLARRARIAVDAVSRSSPASTRAQDADPFGLTPREREVLLLVADGRTNRQIAEALFISESTAGVHVSNILGKLGVASRVEAAGIAFRLQLVSADREAAISS